MVDISQSPALGYLQIVDRRDAATLLPIINDHVAPGPIVHSDKWGAYNQISSLPNVGSHSTVNYSMTFVNPAAGTHTQHVESYWNHCKTKIKQMKGCAEHQIPSNLDKFMWRERHRASRLMAFTNILRDIAAQYPVP